MGAFLPRGTGTAQSNLTEHFEAGDLRTMAHHTLRNSRERKRSRRSD
jgi:hypothetical protein